MKSIKKIIISFALSFLVVIVMQLVWNKFGKSDVSLYVATKDIYKGEKILKQDIKEIKVKKNKSIVKYVNVGVENKIAKENIVSGKVLESSDITSEKLEKSDVESYEYITIEIKDVSDSLAYQLKKDDYINVYYTTKNKKLDNILTNREAIETEINTTFRIFENIKIIGLYDSMGTEVSSGEQYKAIMLRVKAEDAILISSIKSEGTFTVSTVR